MAALVLDKLGRKMCLIIGALAIELSTALLIWSPGFGVVLAARIIEGVSIGFLLLGYQVRCFALLFLVFRSNSS